MTSQDMGREIDEEEKKFSEMHRQLIDLLDDSRYEEAYEVFSDEPEVLGYTNFAELSDMYLGLKNSDDKKAEEFREYILNRVKEWESLHGLVKMLKRLPESSFRGGTQ